MYHRRTSWFHKNFLYWVFTFHNSSRTPTLPCPVTNHFPFNEVQMSSNNVRVFSQEGLSSAMPLKSQPNKASSVIHTECHVDDPREAVLMCHSPPRGDSGIQALSPLHRLHVCCAKEEGGRGARNLPQRCPQPKFGIVIHRFYPLSMHWKLGTWLPCTCKEDWQI